MSKFTNVTIYNLDNEIVVSQLSGNLDQVKTDVSFDTSLNLLGGDMSKLVIDESYYAVGLNESNFPTRSETLKCISTGGEATLHGSIKFPEKPQNYAPKNLAESVGSGADILIQFESLSQTTFLRGAYGSNLQYGFGGLTNSPGPTMAPGAGIQSIGANQLLSTLDEGPADIWLAWICQEKNTSFGVWIHFNFQMFDLGPRPIWYVTSNGSPWALSGNDPSMQYNWDSSVGFNIIGYPTSDHSSLTVLVKITNLK